MKHLQQCLRGIVEIANGFTDIWDAEEMSIFSEKSNDRPPESILVNEFIAPSLNWSQHLIKLVRSYVV